MKRFRNILVVPDRIEAKDRALRRAMELAETNAARLTVAGLLEAHDTPEYLVPLQREVVENMLAQLNHATQEARDRGIPLKTKILIGRAFVEIIRSVLIDKHDLVMKTARGKGQLQPRLFGSTAQHLLRKCPCPVWILDPQPAVGRRGILAAVDADTTDAVEAAINRKILELATSLSLLESAPLHVVHAWNVPFEDMLHHSSLFRITKTEASNYIRDTEGRHRDRLEALVKPFRRTSPGLSVHFVKGVPEWVIADVANETGTEVIIMATLARAGIPGLLIGNTAENVLGRIDTSVLAIKPDEFVSPIAA